MSWTTKSLQACALVAARPFFVATSKMSSGLSEPEALCVVRKMSSSVRMRDAAVAYVER